MCWLYMPHKLISHAGSRCTVSAGPASQSNMLAGLKLARLINFALARSSSSEMVRMNDNVGYKLWPMLPAVDTKG